MNPVQWRACGATAAAVLLVTVGACSGSSSHAAARRPASPSTSTSTRPTSAPLPPVAWSHLHNPILSDANHAVKDAALVAVHGQWFAAFSAVDAAGTWRIGIEHSADLRTWSPMTFMTHDDAVEGEASPDVVRALDGSFVVTYQSFVHDRSGGLPKLYYRTTTDFTRFSVAHPLAIAGMTASHDRLIDAALAWSPAGLLLGFKRGTDAQAFEIARSTSGTLAGPWQIVGEPDIRVFGDTVENYQFLHIDGRWRLLATSNTFDRPYLFDLAGDPTRPRGWLHWSKGRELHIPREPWNTAIGVTGTTLEHANCAFLIDTRADDAPSAKGRFTLLYEDAPEKVRFGGEGHGVLAVAQSADLVHWSVP
jgi:hypothetical protein